MLVMNEFDYSISNNNLYLEACGSSFLPFNINQFMFR